MQAPSQGCMIKTFKNNGKTVCLCLATIVVACLQCLSMEIDREGTVESQRNHKGGLGAKNIALKNRPIRKFRKMEHIDLCGKTKRLQNPEKELAALF